MISEQLEIIIQNAFDLARKKKHEFLTLEHLLYELCKDEEIIPGSAKTGFGNNDILRAITERIPSPEGDPRAPLQAMIFDSVYNSFRGIEAYFKIINGTMNKGDEVQFMATGKTYYADEIGALKLKQKPMNKLSVGEVGYLISGIKDAREVKVGDTITLKDKPSKETPGLAKANNGIIPKATYGLNACSIFINKEKSFSFFL